MRFPSMFSALLCLSLWQPVAHAESVDVVELFTSQGCSSCPSADRLLGELIKENPNLVALEFHVDYWNQLIHGGDGNWVDQFSDAAYTERQQLYNFKDLAGRKGVYTPQMILNGKYAAVGSDRARIIRQLGKNQPEIDISVSKGPSGDFMVDLSNPQGHRSRVWLVTYDLEKTTVVTAGENTNRTITNHRIVKSMQAMDKITSAKATLTLENGLQAGEGCAVLVQSELLEPILGAALCPL